MIQLTDLRLARGPRALLEHADLTLHAGERVGVVVIEVGSISNMESLFGW